MPTLNVEALTQLRRVVHDAPELDMSKVVCDTARCAVGWAVIDPWFQKNTNLNAIIAAEYRGHTFPDLDLTCLQLSRLFGIELFNADRLFGGGLSADSNPDCVSKQEFLDNIDRLLRGEDAQEYAAVINQEED